MVEVPMRTKVKFVVWFVVAMALLTLIGVWRRGWLS